MKPEKKFAFYVGFIYLTITAVTIASSPSITFSGYMMHALISSPHYFRPGNDDWTWEIWNGGRSSGGGGNFSSSLPPSMAGSRIRLNTTIGNPNMPFYLYLPLLFYTAVDYNPGMAQLLISSGSSTTADYVVQAKGALGIISLTSQNMRRRAPWIFSDLGDPLGALKLPNTAEPTMTFKYTGELPFGFEGVGYYVADNRCNFIPIVEQIPSKVYAVLGQTPEAMKFFDETPSYAMSRVTRQMGSSLTLGAIWGQKQAINLNPRSEDEQRGAPRNQTHGVGYNKTNFGFDLSGTLPLKNNPKLVIAAVASEGQWQQQKRAADGLLSAVDLGTTCGNAYKLEVAGLQLGKASLSGSYHNVSPQFQWIAVRNSRYAYTKHHNSPSNPSVYYYGWRPVLDDEFLLRNSNEKDAYLSDISTYFGLEVSQLKLDLPGRIIVKGKSFPSNLLFETDIVENQGNEGSYFDPISWQDNDQGYKKFQAKLDIKTATTSKLTLLAGEQLYNQNFFEQRQNIRQELGFGYEGKITPYLNYSSQLSKLWRSKEDDGLSCGVGEKLFFNLKGETDSGIGVKTTLGFLAGTYTDDLCGIKDTILESTFTDLSIEQYAELVNNFIISSLGIEAKIAGEVIYRTSSLPDRSGLSLVGYVEGNSRLSNNIMATVVGIGVTGPKKDGFSSNSLRSVIDYKIVYRPFSSKDNSLDLDLTRRYTEGGTKTNCYLRWNTRKGRNSLSFIYGYKPTNENRYMIAGTPWEARYSMPAKELLARPWYLWRDQAIYSDETYENYLSVNWSFFF